MVMRGWVILLGVLYHTLSIIDHLRQYILMYFPHHQILINQYQQLTRQLRALDLIWQIQGDQSHIAIFLMPLTTKDGSGGTDADRPVVGSS